MALKNLSSNEVLIKIDCTEIPLEELGISSAEEFEI